MLITGRAHRCKILWTQVDRTESNFRVGIRYVSVSIRNYLITFRLLESLIGNATALARTAKAESSLVKSIPTIVYLFGEGCWLVDKAGLDIVLLLGLDGFDLRR